MSFQVVVHFWRKIHRNLVTLAIRLLRLPISFVDFFRCIVLRTIVFHTQHIQCKATIGCLLVIHATAIRTGRFVEQAGKYWNFIEFVLRNNRSVYLRLSGNVDVSLSLWWAASIVDSLIASVIDQSRWIFDRVVYFVQHTVLVRVVLDR